jgi:hypothetical protein
VVDGEKSVDDVFKQIVKKVEKINKKHKK